MGKQDRQMEQIQVKITEKPDAITGERICAVGMFLQACKRSRSWEHLSVMSKPSKSTRLFVYRNQRWNLHKSYLEQRRSLTSFPVLGHGYGWVASQPGGYHFSLLVTSWLLVNDTNCSLKFVFFLLLRLVLEDARWSRGDSGRPARSHKLSISICASSTKLHLIRDVLKLYDLIVVHE